MLRIEYDYFLTATNDHDMKAERIERAALALDILRVAVGLGDPKATEALRGKMSFPWQSRPTQR